jgi:hypothetical protein
VQKTGSKFIPSSEIWKQAEQMADRRSPRPVMSTALAAATGFFGSGVVSMVALTFAGLDVDVGAGRQALGITTILCGAIGYFVARSMQNAHNKAFADALGEIEEDWRVRNNSN